MLSLILKEGKSLTGWGYVLGLYNISHLALQSFLSIERKRNLSSLVIIQYIKTSFPGVDSIQVPKISILSNVSESIELLEH